MNAKTDANMQMLAHRLKYSQYRKRMMEPPVLFTLTKEPTVFRRPTRQLTPGQVNTSARLRP